MYQDKVIYVNNSATSYPKPPEVAWAVMQALELPPEMSGRGEGAGSEDKVTAARGRIARFFGCSDPDRIIFCSNASDALNLAIHGFVNALESRPIHVVTTTNDHNSVLRPLRTLEANGRIGLTIVPSDSVGNLSAKEIEAAMRRDTELLAVNHLSNVVGTIAPVEELARICRKRGVTLLVDAAQSASVLPIDVEQSGIDLLAFTGHKYMLGPTGIGGLYIGENVKLVPRKQGGTGVKSEYPFQPEELPVRYEAGTVNYIGIVGLDAALGYIQEVGLKAVRSRMTELRAECEEGLRRLPSVKVYGPDTSAEKGAIVSFTVDGHGVEEVGEILRQHYRIITRSGLHCAPLCHERLGAGAEGAVRASFSVLSDPESPEALVRAVAEIART